MITWNQALAEKSTALFFLERQQSQCHPNTTYNQHRNDKTTLLLWYSRRILFLAHYATKYNPESKQTIKWYYHAWMTLNALAIG